MIKRIFVGAVALIALVGCGGSSTTSDVIIKEDSVIIDVRTPAEFADGHVEGAINMDLEGGVFEEEFASLDPSQSYIVYCRTGRRSGVAHSILKDNGFTDVIDLETLDNAANKTGLPVVTN